MGGEEAAAEVAVVGSPQQFDFEVRLVFLPIVPSEFAISSESDL